MEFGRPPTPMVLTTVFVAESMIETEPFGKLLLA
jgi:hypothetical protein